jgi:ribosomal protein L9
MTVRGVDSVGNASVEVGRSEVAEEPEETDAAVAYIDFEFEHAAGIDGKGFGSVVRKEIVAAADMDCAP